MFFLIVSTLMDIYDRCFYGMERNYVIWKKDQPEEGGRPEANQLYLFFNRFDVAFAPPMI